MKKVLLILTLFSLFTVNETLAQKGRSATASRGSSSRGSKATTSTTRATSSKASSASSSNIDRALKGAQLKSSKVVGNTAENATTRGLKAKGHSNINSQVTIKTQSGVRTRIDNTSEKGGKIRLTETKSSKTAPLTKNQEKAFPEIQKSGGTVVSRGKSGLPRGTEIPPTKVDVKRY
jgi:hypothetical protein